MNTGWLVGVLLVLTMVPAQAQQVDSRWAPWLGCWQLIDESVQEGGPTAVTRARPDETRVCVVAADTTAGVTLITRIEGQSVLEQTIVADGAPHPIDETDCRGWQRAAWSRAGERLFASADLFCAGEAPRQVSGLAMITGGRWIDIQAIDIAGRQHVRVRRYQRAADQQGIGAAPASQAAAMAPYVGAMRFTLEEVKEAAASLSPRAVEAALVATSARFNLNGKALIDLDEAGVPDSVIDLMVALSFPERFIVERARTQTTSGSTGYGSVDPYALSPYDAGLNDGFWDGPYAPYYYAPFGYAYWAGYGVPYYPFTGFVTIDPAQPAPADSTGRARLVNGAGYTQIRSREAERVEGGASGTRSGDAPAGSGSSGGVSSQGFSSGGSSTDTGRTAEPR